MNGCVTCRSNKPDCWHILWGVGAFGQETKNCSVLIKREEVKYASHKPVRHTLFLPFLSLCSVPCLCRVRILFVELSQSIVHRQESGNLPLTIRFTPNCPSAPQTDICRRPMALHSRKTGCVFYGDVRGALKCTGECGSKARGYSFGTARQLKTIKWNCAIPHQSDATVLLRAFVSLVYLSHIGFALFLLVSTRRHVSSSR